MSENLNDTPTPDQPPQHPTFSDAVKNALERIQFKPKCSGCSTIGWASFEIFAAPLYVPVVMSNQGVAVAGMICLKCGEMNLKNLQHLGITLTMEERKVLTAAEIAGQQKQPLIVAP